MFKDVYTVVFVELDECAIVMNRLSVRL